MTPADQLMNLVQWRPIIYDETMSGNNEVFATHEGELNLGGFSLKCYQLSNGKRVISSESLIPFLDALTPPPEAGR